MAEQIDSPLAMDTDNLAIYASGAHRGLASLRRTSSGNLSSSSYGLGRTRSRRFSRTSTTDTLPLPAIREDESANTEDSSHWQTFALLFVAAPAIAGLFFENGAALMTDILLLGLGCLFLYWSVKWPWEWYRLAQTRVFVSQVDDDFALGDESEDEMDTKDFTENDDENQARKEEDSAPTKVSEKAEFRRAAAARKLRRDELLALFSCFTSPVCVAYLLHAVRPYLSRPSGGLVSNSNLTLFVLASEVRPILHLCRMIEKRTLHLQKVVTEEATPPTSTRDETATTIQNLIERVCALDQRLQTPAPKPDIPTNGKQRSREQSPTKQESEATALALKLSIQPQLDALNRAVRRYEKRATIQSMALDARLRDLDNRVNDALSLAAAASRNSNRPGLLAWAFDGIWTIIVNIIAAATEIILMPWTLLQRANVFLFGSKRKKKRAGKEDNSSGSPKDKKRRDI